MATAALLRSLRRHDVVSAPLFAFRLRAALEEPSLGASLCRVFSSGPVINDTIGTGLGTHITSDAIGEGKSPKGFENAAGARITPSFVGFSDRRELLLGTASFGTRRLFTTKPDTQEEQHSPKRQSLRPLSPHLPVYQPQMNSMLSIFNRISAVYLTGVVLAGHLVYMKMGMVCLTYPSFYQFLFHTSKLIPFFKSLTIIAVLYHVVHGIHSLMTHAKPFPKLFR
ncbi:PREDICTED: succinate dehydrogenase subunit 3-1, mitochondrial-like isoform X1 [Tarenaya hassleriana]|uniref:succinate dehydrogenase subunit 3-1, mitochondrial-like isoform X2 n=1 Tax=Tarenaya hassleriana TaxID=28532 RepID=UPI00053C2A61|nr:PREDICTED: succinate dehydrogenase subunit 3-1, mitochondrial-like isoform X2 [Tarenaya hassleriana]XP_019056743.1 PREDICTED: succinate dehydrogenase subunit 3-1, mitochondrial-like isoform X1 [Tarenaya hassleriana]